MRNANTSLDALLRERFAFARRSHHAWLGYRIRPWLHAVGDFDDSRASRRQSLASLTMVAGDLSAGRILRLLARFGWLLEEGAIVGMRALAVTGALSLLPTRRAAALLTDLAARLRRRALRAVGFAFRVGAECRRHANE